MVGVVLDGGFGELGLADEGEDLGEGGVGPDTGGPHEDAAVLVGGATQDGIVDALWGEGEKTGSCELGGGTGPLAASFSLTLSTGITSPVIMLSST